MKETIYLCRYGEDITQEIRSFLQDILDNPKITIEFDVDYSGCYYESDEPSYRLIISDGVDE